ncbi:unnamed protein product [Schistocephalus solidus]|uniref:Uncharacterized protein n=1 Tax=Schistocephalus solidus TaxID=70667 RepID=A0A183TFH8_SCHSO|nr:unnamed protein product [Schistocephalus solidus]
MKKKKKKKKKKKGGGRGGGGRGGGGRGGGPMSGLFDRKLIDKRELGREREVNDGWELVRPAVMVAWSAGHVRRVVGPENIDAPAPTTANSHLRNPRGRGLSPYPPFKSTVEPRAVKWWGAWSHVLRGRSLNRARAALAASHSGRVTRAGHHRKESMGN